MISTPTVLILGAGASAHCGYPLGRALVGQLCALRTAARVDGIPAGWDRDHLNAFLLDLSRSDPSSIDTFLEANRDRAEFGKFLIARQLKQLESLDALFPPKDAGWYRYLFDSLFSGGLSRFAENRLNIVTFNYDRSLEAYFLARLRASYRLGEDDAGDVLARLSIIYVHGILGAFPEHPYQATVTTDELSAIARAISIIHELPDNNDDFCNELFRRSNRALQGAQRILFLGFGFHPDNVRRLRYFTAENVVGKVIHATAHGLAPIDRDLILCSLPDTGISSAALRNCSCNEFFSHVVGLE